MPTPIKEGPKTRPKGTQEPKKAPKSEKKAPKGPQKEQDQNYDSLRVPSSSRAKPSPREKI